MRLVTVTGEASGDLIAADALRRLSNGAADLELGGIGGDRLRAWAWSVGFGVMIWRFVAMRKRSLNWFTFLLSVTGF